MKWIVRRVCMGALMVAILATLPLFTCVTQAASSFASLPAGHAYAQYVAPTIATVLNSGTVLAPSSITCTEASTSSTAHRANLATGTIATSGTADTAVTNTQTPTSGSIQASVSMHNVNLLGGLMTAAGIQVTVSSTASASGVTSAVQQASFSGLLISGSPADSNPAPNTVKSLPGIGTAILNEQFLTSGSQLSRIVVNMIDIHVTAANNSFGLPVNSQIIMGHADTSELLQAQPATAQGAAYGTYAFNGNSTTMAPLAYAITDCAGGSSQKNLSSNTTPPIGTTGSTTDSATSSITASGSTASGRATISGLNLLGGQVRADNVTAQADAAFNGTGSGSASTTLTNATIAGSAQSQNPAPNTYVPIPGVGYAYLNEQLHNFSASGAFEMVYALDIHVTNATNVLGLPVGTRIIVGSASATIQTF